MRLINFNGNIQSENIPAIHSWNRAFRYGDGLFESIVVAGKKIPFIDNHWKRVTSGAKLMSLEFSPNFTTEFLQKSIIELLALNSIDGNACARLMVYREGKGRYNPDEMQAGFVIEAEPLQGELYELNKKGLSIGVFKDVSKSVDTLSNFKTCSSLVYVLASIYKSKSGWDDCMILNSRSNICDSCNSNVFLVKDKILYTPSLDEGCINGVMRKQIISLAKSNEFIVQEISIETDMLRNVDEVFLTNAVSGIRWVGSYANIKYQNEVSSILSNSLRTLVS